MKKIDFEKVIQIPFEERGRGWNGVDCWGLVRLVASEYFDLDYPEYAEDYQNISDVKELSRLLRQHQVDFREVSFPEPGDIVLLRISGAASHVGIFIGGGKFIHAEINIGVNVGELSSPIWAKRILGYYRYEKSV